MDKNNNILNFYLSLLSLSETLNEIEPIELRNIFNYDYYKTVNKCKKFYEISFLNSRSNIFFNIKKYTSPFSSVNNVILTTLIKLVTNNLIKFNNIEKNDLIEEYIQLWFYNVAIDETKTKIIKFPKLFYRVNLFNQYKFDYYKIDNLDSNDISFSYETILDILNKDNNDYDYYKNIIIKNYMNYLKSINTNTFKMYLTKTFSFEYINFCKNIHKNLCNDELNNFYEEIENNKINPIEFLYLTEDDIIKYLFILAYFYSNLGTSENNFINTNFLKYFIITFKNNKKLFKIINEVINNLLNPIFNINFSDSYQAKVKLLFKEDSIVNRDKYEIFQTKDDIKKYFIYFIINNIIPETSGGLFKGPIFFNSYYLNYYNAVNVFTINSLLSYILSLSEIDYKMSISLADKTFKKVVECLFNFENFFSYIVTVYSYYKFDNYFPDNINDCGYRCQIITLRKINSNYKNNNYSIDCNVINKFKKGFLYYFNLLPDEFKDIFFIKLNQFYSEELKNKNIKKEDLLLIFKSIFNCKVDNFKFFGKVNDYERYKLEENFYLERTGIVGAVLDEDKNYFLSFLENNRKGRPSNNKVNNHTVNLLNQLNFEISKRKNLFDKKIKDIIFESML